VQAEARFYRIALSLWRIKAPGATQATPIKPLKSF